MYCVEIGYEGDHVHFLIQSVPTVSASQLIRTMKSITAKELFRRPPRHCRGWNPNGGTGRRGACGDCSGAPFSPGPPLPIPH